MRRAFISFDFDNDQELKHLFAGQFKLPESPFEAADWSMKEAAPQPDWEAEAERKIKRSDVVIVIVGKHTHRAPGVLKEVAIARRLDKRIFQIIGHTGSSPIRVPGAGRMIRWSWKNLSNILNET